MSRSKIPASLIHKIPTKEETWYQEYLWSNLTSLFPEDLCKKLVVDMLRESNEALKDTIAIPAERAAEPVDYSEEMTEEGKALFESFVEDIKKLEGKTFGEITPGTEPEEDEVKEWVERVKKTSPRTMARCNFERLRRRGTQEATSS